MTLVSEHLQRMVVDIFPGHPGLILSSSHNDSDHGHFKALISNL